MAVWEKIKNHIQLLSDKFSGWYADLNDHKKRLFALTCTGIFAVILMLSVVISIFGGKIADDKTEPERVYLRVVIPGEEVFLPDEPDFIPGIMLERERRDIWTEEDAAVYWQDPLKSGEENWREKIEDAVEKLLELVP